MPQVDTNTLNTVKFDSLMMQIKDAMYKSGFTYATSRYKH